MGFTCYSGSYGGLAVVFLLAGVFVPFFFLLLFRISFAVAAGPQVALALAVVVDLVDVSLLVGAISVWGAGGELMFWAMFWWSVVFLC
jgi:hypothetical protein